MGRCGVAGLGGPRGSTLVARGQGVPCPCPARLGLTSTTGRAESAGRATGTPCPVDEREKKS